VIVLVVRHGSAGQRANWEGDDRLRPLDQKGRRQADGLVELLRGYPIERIVSSPYTRCTQSVEPVARARRLELERSDSLAEGATRAQVVELLGARTADCVVVCTHGDVVEALVGVELPKGSVQVLELAAGGLSPGSYLGRPSA
jgi:phosphohistidine phosphatase SixA